MKGKDLTFKFDSRSETHLALFLLRFVLLCVFFLGGRQIKFMLLKSPAGITSKRRRLNL